MKYNKQYLLIKRDKYMLIEGHLFSSYVRISNQMFINPEDAIKKRYMINYVIPISLEEYLKDVEIIVQSDNPIEISDIPCSI